MNQKPKSIINIKKIKTKKLKMRPNCPYESCYCRAGKNGFCLKHKDIGEAIEALLLLSKNNENKNKNKIK